MVTGVSARMPSEELARRIGLAWESQPEPRHAFSLEVISTDRPSIYVNLGPHPPRLWPEDLDRLHELWLRMGAKPRAWVRSMHHRDILGSALRRLERDLTAGERDQGVEGPERRDAAGLRKPFLVSSFLVSGWYATTRKRR